MSERPGLPEPIESTDNHRRLVRRFAWFLLLWIAGVGAVAVVGLLIRSVLAGT